MNWFGYQELYEHIFQGFREINMRFANLGYRYLILGDNL